MAGVGYVKYSSAFDSSSRSGMVVKGTYVATSGINIKKGSIIFCDGEKWIFAGETKVSNTTFPAEGTVQVTPLGAPSAHFVPCITVQGSFRVTNIVLE